MIRRMRNLTMHDKQLSPRWETDRDLASGWARYRTQPLGAEKTIHRFYKQLQKKAAR